MHLGCFPLSCVLHCLLSIVLSVCVQGHSSTIRTLIMHSMAEWYMRGDPMDQKRLTRILDVAQDLKVGALDTLQNLFSLGVYFDR
jgi:hypothetical protein